MNRIYHVSPVAHSFDPETIQKAIDVVKKKYGGQMSFMDGVPGAVLIVNGQILLGERHRLGLVEYGSAEGCKEHACPTV